MEASPRGNPNGGKAPIWFGYVHGQHGSYGVTASEEQLRTIMVADTEVCRKDRKEEAWEWVLARLKPTPPPAKTPAHATESKPHKRDAPEELPTEETKPPPTSLAGKDPSVKNKDEVFGISLTANSSKVAQKLAPKCVGTEEAKKLGGTLLDVLAMPGKLNSVEDDDVTGEIRDALWVVMAKEDHEGIPKDMKWQQVSRNAVASCKTAEDLKELKDNVEEVKAQHLRRATEQQLMLFRRCDLDETLAEAWSSEGYISTINRRGVKFYLSFLDHVMLLCSTQGWEAAKTVTEHYTKTWRLIRQNSTSRLLAMLQLFVTLRDGYEADWLSLKLTDKKVNGLITRGGTGAQPEAGG